jgi:hypothetical protein
VTAPQERTVAQVLRELTPAQRKWLPTFSAEWRGWLPIGMAKGTRKRLIELGLVEEQRPQYFGNVKWRWTTLGADVAAALVEAQP